MRAPRVRIIFPEGVPSDRASMTYRRYGPTGGHVYAGVPGASKGSPFEIPMDKGDRFRAIVWAPGCKIKTFDVAVETSDIGLEFLCDPLKTIPFFGRVKSAENPESATISVSYDSLGVCLWINDCKDRCAGSCLGPQIARIATTKVGADGTFRLELPDFSDDPFVADSGGELDFGISGLKGHFILKPEPAKGLETRAVSIDVAASYPAEVTFVAVPLEEFFRSNTQ